MMAAPPLPAIFLSHSGKQKPFVSSLYRELLHVNHNPFFDGDARMHSLPKGTFFPARILDACRACKLGVVVLSHDYIESFWPMWELQHLAAVDDPGPSSGHTKLYPIFYKLKPADLRNPENLERWKSFWESERTSWHKRAQDIHNMDVASEACKSPTHLDIDSWPRALQMLQYQNGEVLVLRDNEDEHAFIQAIVSNICKRLPPPLPFLMGNHFKGAEYIQQEIDELFQQQHQIMDEETNDLRRTPVAVGLYGIGGSGKSTVCKYMLNFYSKEFLWGRFLLEFPSEGVGKHQRLLQSIKNVLSSSRTLSKETLNQINTIEQAMPHLQHLLRMDRVFLILDNVWDWAFLEAKQIVTMDFMPGSRLLVTARSEFVLQALSKDTHILPTMKITHVPSISEEEAMVALMAYSLTSCCHGISNADDLRGLARSCFFGDQCYPLLLQAVGAKLRHRGGHISSREDWIQLLSDLQAQHGIHSVEGIKDMVVNVLKTSYEYLSSQLQETFLKLGTCMPKEYHSESLSGVSEWLSMICRTGTIEGIRSQLIELEYHGLIQTGKGNKVVIHELQMMLIERLVQDKDGVPRCYFFSGDMATLSASEQWRRCIYIDGQFSEKLVTWDQRRVFNPAEEGRLKHMMNVCFPCSQVGDCDPNLKDIEVLKLRLHRGVHSLSCKHLQSLRYLMLDGAWNEVEAVKGWHGAPNLVSVKIENCSGLKNIESMRCLSRLESLVIRGCEMWRGSPDHLPLKLKELDLSGCTKWVSMGMPSSYTSLERCILRNTGISMFPDISSTNLRVLDLSECRNLRSMEGSLCGLVALEELSLEGCGGLVSIPDLTQLVNLRRLKPVDFLGSELAGPSRWQRNRRQLAAGICRGMISVLQSCSFSSEEEVLCKSGEEVPSIYLSGEEVLCKSEESCSFSSGEEVPSILSEEEVLFKSREEVSSILSGEEVLCKSEEEVLFKSREEVPSILSLSVLLPSTLTNLRSLTMTGANLPFQNHMERSANRLLDLFVRDMPRSLEKLTLSDFDTPELITGLSALDNLEHLSIRGWPRLKRIIALGSLSKLVSLDIRYCKSLRDVGHWDWEPASGILNKCSLKSVEIYGCPELETLSTMRYLTSLAILLIGNCPKLQPQMLPSGARKLGDGSYAVLAFNADDFFETLELEDKLLELREVVGRTLTRREIRKGMNEGLTSVLADLPLQTYQRDTTSFPS